MDRCVGAAARLPGSDRKDLAIEALAGSATVSDLAARHGVSRKFIYQQTHKAVAALDDAFSSATPDDEVLGVVQNPPILGYTDARKPPARDGRISIGRMSVAGGGWPPRLRLAGAEAVPGPAGSASADGPGRSSTLAGFCRGVRHVGCA